MYICISLSGSYAQFKLAMILTAKEFNKRYKCK